MTLATLRGMLEHGGWAVLERLRRHPGVWCAFSVLLGGLITPCHFVPTKVWEARDVAVYVLQVLLALATAVGISRWNVMKAEADAEFFRVGSEGLAPTEQGLEKQKSERLEDRVMVQLFASALPGTLFILGFFLSSAYSKSAWLVLACAALMILSPFLLRLPRLALEGRRARLLLNLSLLYILTTIALSAARRYTLPQNVASYWTLELFIAPVKFIEGVKFIEPVMFSTALIGALAFLLVTLVCVGLGERPDHPPLDGEAVRKAEFTDTKDDAGLALSGGGIRAGTVSMGALQTLFNRGVLQKLTWLSSVSGSGWAVGAVLSRLIQPGVAGSATNPADSAVARFRGGRDYLGISEGSQALVAPVLYTVIATATSTLAIILFVVSASSFLLYLDQTRLEQLHKDMDVPYTATLSRCFEVVAMRIDPLLAWFGVGSVPDDACPPNVSTHLTSARALLGLMLIAGLAMLLITGLLILASQLRLVGQAALLKELPNTVRRIGSLAVGCCLFALFFLGLMFSFKLAVSVLIIVLILAVLARTLDFSLARSAAISTAIVTVGGWLSERGEWFSTFVDDTQHWWAGRVAVFTSYLLKQAAVVASGWQYPQQTGLLFLASTFAAGVYVLGVLLALEQVGLWRFWRDRLDAAFWRTTEHEVPLTWDAVKKVTGSGSSFPLPIINATLNAPRSEEGDAHFEFTPSHLGSPRTGWAVRRTADCELVDALAISSAAVNSQGGSSIPKALRSLLSLVQLKMGRWVRAPTTRADAAQPHALEYVGLEALGLNSPEDPFVLVSDGGHLENLGLLALLRRRTKIMLCIDAAADPDYTFGDLAKFVSLATAEGWDVDLKVDVLCPPLEANGSGLRTPRAQVAVGTLTRGDSLRYLIYAKSTLSPALNVGTFAYARRTPEFPQETTVDQAFDTEQFEAYLDVGRTLGTALANAYDQLRPSLNVIEE